MKKNQIILLSVLLVLGIALALFFYKKQSADRLSKFVPKDAVSVMEIDLVKMGSKIKFNELAEMKFMTKGLLRELSSSNRDWAEKFMKDPSTSGIDFLQNPLMFIHNNAKSDEEPVLCFAFGVSNAKKLIETIDNVGDKNLKVSDPDDQGYYKVSDEDEDEAILYFNDDQGFLLVDLMNKDISLKNYRNKILELSNDDNIRSNDDYSSAHSAPHDLMLYVNKTSVKSMLENSNEFSRSSEQDLLKSYVNRIPYGITLSFDNNLIQLKSLNNDQAKDQLPMLQKDGLDEKSLSKIDADGNPLAYMTMNLNMKNIFEFVKTLPNSDEFFELVDQFASAVNVPSDQILNILNGKMSLSLTGINDNEGSPMPAFLLSAGLDNANVLNDVLTNFPEEQLIQYDGIWIINETMNGSLPLGFVIADNSLYFSNDFELLQAKNENTAWKSLNESLGKSNAQKYPVSLYADLRYKTYEPIIRSFFSGNETEMMEKSKPIWNKIDHFSASGDEKESEMTIAFNNGNENSLWTMITMLEDAYKIFD